MKRVSWFLLIVSVAGLLVLAIWWLYDLFANNTTDRMNRIETPWGPAYTVVTPGPPPAWIVDWEGEDDMDGGRAAADQLILGLSRQERIERVASVLEGWAEDRGWELGDFDVRVHVEPEYSVELTSQRELALGGKPDQAISAIELLTALDQDPADFGASFVYSAPKFLRRRKARPNRCVNSNQWANDFIGASDWWRQASQEIQAIPLRSTPRVAVLDQGISDGIPDLKDRILRKEGISVVGGDPLTASEHGVGLAGIIGALHRDDPVDGVALQIEMIPIQVAKPTFAVTVAAFANGLKRLLKKTDVKIAMIADGFESSRDVCGLFQKDMDELKSRGVVLVASVPNRSPNLSFPTICPFENMLVVGAVDKNGEYKSARGGVESRVQIVAPGAACTIDPSGQAISWKDSASAATALVAGAMALALSAYPEGDATALALRDRFLEKAPRVGRDRLKFPALCLEGLVPPNVSANVKCRWSP